MRAKDMISLCRGSEEHVARWVDICLEGDRKEDEWIAMLRSKGIKAAHPDDGWVDREENAIRFCYPQFNDGCKVGDKIALGWPDDWRIVLITDKEESKIFSNFSRWKFTNYEICK